MSMFSKEYQLYFQLFRFMLKYWNSNLVSAREIGETDNSEEWDHSPEELREDLKEMGPTFIKLGQLLSTRPDMLPKRYLEALADLQDQAGNACSIEDINTIFEEEMGQNTSRIYSKFNPEPLASASIGQVHQAILPTGEKVAVKIRKPGIKKRFVEDMEVLAHLAGKAEKYHKESRKYSVHSIVEELKYILFQELDYANELKNLISLRENLKEFEYLIVPKVYPRYCTSRILTMEFIEGKKVTALTDLQKRRMAKEKIVEDFIEAYLKQIILDGLAQADPHPGNIHIVKNKKLALLDLGMVARFDEQMKDNILKLMIALGGNDGDNVVKILLGMCQYDDEKANIEHFKKQVKRKVQENENSRAKDLQTGKTILEVNKIAAQQEIQLPAEMISLGKILLNMDQIIAFLAPDYKMQKTVRRYIEHLMRHRAIEEIKSGNILQTLLESKEFMTNLPYRLNKISDNLANNNFKVEMDAFNENNFLKALQKVANRITVGVIIAALILGAALIMRIPTTWMLWGYPGFAVILFIIAALIGFYLVYQILFIDEKDRDDKF